MRLPTKLLDQIRVGVGASVMMLSGCDRLDAALAEIAPADEPVTIAPVALPEPAAPKRESAPDPSIGIASRVVEALETVRPSAPRFEEARDDEPAIRPPEDVTAFVPFAGGSTPTPSPKRVRKKPIVAVAPIAVDEPCGTETIVASPSLTHDPCPACGRG